jgi:hypothetical protein
MYQPKINLTKTCGTNREDTYATTLCIQLTRKKENFTTSKTPKKNLTTKQNHHKQKKTSKRKFPINAMPNPGLNVLFIFLTLADNDMAAHPSPQAKCLLQLLCAVCTRLLS